jgi:hypothetical protein
MTDQIVIEQTGGSWAVKHNDGFLGFTQTREEAAVIAADLAEWIHDQGRRATVCVAEPRSCSDPGVTLRKPVRAALNRSSALGGRA